MKWKCDGPEGLFYVVGGFGIFIGFIAWSLAHLTNGPYSITPYILESSKIQEKSRKTIEKKFEQILSRYDFNGNKCIERNELYEIKNATDKSAIEKILSTHNFNIYDLNKNECIESNEVLNIVETVLQKK